MHAPRQNILLINFHSTRNAGDLALLEAAIRQLQNAFPEPSLTVSANYPGERYFQDRGLQVVASPASIVYNNPSEFLQILRLLVLWLFSWLTSKLPDANISGILPQEWQQLLGAYLRADLVVGCPGNQFFTMGKVGWPLLVSGLAVLIAHQFKKPFYVMPQSLGPLQRAWERRWMRRLYSQARLVYLRDNLSLALAHEIGLPGSRLHLVPDLAFASEIDNRALDNSYIKKWDLETRSSRIGVTVIRRMVKSLNPELLENYYLSLAGALTHMVQNYGLEVFFFPQVTGPSDEEDDRLAARYVAERMKIPQANFHLIDELVPPEDLKSLYRYMDIFVASRLHSGIFALNEGVPVLFIGYLTKTRGVLEDLGMEEWQVDLGEVSESLLFDKIERLWQQREQVRAELEAKLPVYAGKSKQVGRQIYLDFIREEQH